MITGMDKALIAVLGGGIFLAESLGGFSFGLPPDWVTGVAAVLTPILVYFVPNSSD